MSDPNIPQAEKQLRFLCHQVAGETGFCNVAASDILSQFAAGLSSDQFADYVFEVEGMRPASHPKSYTKIRSMFEKKFGPNFEIPPIEL